MTGTPPTRDELIAGLNTAWDELQATISELGPARLTVPTDPNGWTGQDHLDHIAAWERSMTALFRGRPRHEGLGIDARTYFTDDIDTINAAIRETTRGRSLEATIEDLTTTHTDFTSIVAGLTDDQLLLPYAHYLPDEPGEPDPSPIAWRVQGNGGEHIREHLGYIREIARGQSGHST